MKSLTAESCFLMHSGYPPRPGRDPFADEHPVHGSCAMGRISCAVQRTRLFSYRRSRVFCREGFSRKMLSLLMVASIQLWVPTPGHLIQTILSQTALPDFPFSRGPNSSGPSRPQGGSTLCTALSSLLMRRSPKHRNERHRPGEAHAVRQRFAGVPSRPPSLSSLSTCQIQAFAKASFASAVLPNAFKIVPRSFQSEGSADSISRSWSLQASASS